LLTRRKTKGSARPVLRPIIDVAKIVETIAEKVSQSTPPPALRRQCVDRILTDFTEVEMRNQLDLLFFVKGIIQ
jgi:hypothetical protein